jgi:cytochrome c peroxidase
MIYRGSRTDRNVSRIALAGVIVACMVLSPWISWADESGTAGPSFNDAELKTILSHGPWPTPIGPDPSNRVSGKPDAIELGTVLFFDQRLSGSGTKACATCHVPERNWTDNLSRGVGMAQLDRNTPTLMNLRGQRWYGWDGGADSLWSQSLRPILDARELAATPRHVANLLRNDEELSCRYRRVFGAPPSPTDDDAVFVNVGKVLAAFQETLVSGRTPFDHFRDALARGESLSSQTYSTPAQRGLQIFIGKGGCSACHSGGNFTSGEFFKTGLSRAESQTKPDPGRPKGIRELRESRFNLLSAYNDDATGAGAARTRQVAFAEEGDGRFKVPTLRNLMLTGPYGHNGEVDTLAEVVRRHAADGQPAGAPSLTPREQTDLVVFLESLSTFANPWRPEEASRCD